MFHDRRAVARQTTHLTAKIYCSSFPALSCSVLNVSSRGARLEFTAPPPDHDNFMLIFDGSGQVYCGSVRWRCGTSVGIEFEEDADDLPI
ncbi:PilZ domain-containing protein [Enterovirga rhinocerotis]|uniref:PilZ domain-containing protein n=1 Tax=Enterovirga rhinocerotis TaxID=1339210 RepID=A0A4R7BTI3_9HYPH|nr:PilZ domain-containing protein [Enterovirga rhinocerotis]TDR88232.1 hypothetical protein EV668_4104 [Enterovirga rhinocerotis]